MQYFINTSTKKWFVIDLKFKLKYNWELCVLSGNLAFSEKEENYFSDYLLITLQKREREREKKEGEKRKEGGSE